MNPSQTPSIVALIPCAGSGLRAGGERPKQYQTLAGEPLVSHTLAALAKVSRIGHILLVVAPDDTWAAPILAGYGQRWPNHAVQLLPAGGASRAETVLNGLTALLGAGHSPDAWVLVHDAARCLITPEQINHLISECEYDPVGGLLACPVTDTLKSGDQGKSQKTLARDGKWAAQTPQMFRLEPLRAALQSALQAGLPLTDEASAFEALGQAPKLVRNSSPNFKVTYADDFLLAEALLQQRRYAPAFRIGEGWDTHQLVDQATTGRRLILGGIDIPYSKGLLGHSDADALCHAITDALLGAAGLGDIGKHFPDTDPRYQGADSVSLLNHTAELIKSNGWTIANVDSTIIAQAPKMAPHIDAMRRKLAVALGLDPSQVNVKAKTAEKLGPVGEGLSIETRAVVMLIQSVAAAR